MNTSVACRYYHNEAPHRSFWIVGVKPFGIHETMIENISHYDISQAIEDMAFRLNAAMR